MTSSGVSHLVFVHSTVLLGGDFTKGDGTGGECGKEQSMNFFF